MWAERAAPPAAAAWQLLPPVMRVRKLGLWHNRVKGWRAGLGKRGGLKKNQARKRRVRVVVQYSGTACAAHRRNDMRVDAREYQQWCGGQVQQPRRVDGEGAWEGR